MGSLLVTWIYHRLKQATSFVIIKSHSEGKDSKVTVVDYFLTRRYVSAVHSCMYYGHKFTNLCAQSMHLPKIVLLFFLYFLSF